MNRDSRIPLAIGVAAAVGYIGLATGWSPVRMAVVGLFGLGVAGLVRYAR